MKSMGRRVSLSLCAAALFVAGLPEPARAASYLPLSDEELARRAPIIVRAQVIAQEIRLEIIQGQDFPSTLTSFRVIEVLKGQIAADTFRLELAGGQIGEIASWIPGTPEFAPDAEVILFLAPVPWHASDFSFTEFGLSKFDILEDAGHRRFAVRPVFEPEEDDIVSKREPEPRTPVLHGPGRGPGPERVETAASAGAGVSGPRRFRDADSFLDALRSAGAGGEFPRVEYKAPEGDLRTPGGGIRPFWVNIGGTENGTNNLFRWFFDTGDSPDAKVVTSGTQTGLANDDPNCGTDYGCDVTNAVTKWTTVASTSVHYSQSSGTGIVTVNLDVASHATDWTTPLDCMSGGVIGLGGPGESFGPHTFKGDSNYFAPRSGDVWMRQITGGCYSARTFRAGVLHEMGHTLGLGHPDQEASIHSVICPISTCTAVMTSTIPVGKPDTPQPDDIAGIQWYYGTGAAPTANFSFSPTSPNTGQLVSFTDTSTGSPTSWAWNFGDSASGAANTSMLKNPTHTFASRGSYTVTLTATNSSGSNQIAKQVSICRRCTRVVPFRPPA